MEGRARQTAGVCRWRKGVSLILQTAMRALKPSEPAGRDRRHRAAAEESQQHGDQERRGAPGPGGRSGRASPPCALDRAFLRRPVQRLGRDAGVPHRPDPRQGQDRDEEPRRDDAPSGPAASPQPVPVVTMARHSGRRGRNPPRPGGMLCGQTRKPHAKPRPEASARRADPEKQKIEVPRNHRTARPVPSCRRSRAGTSSRATGRKSRMAVFATGTGCPRHVMLSGTPRRSRGR